MSEFESAADISRAADFILTAADRALARLLYARRGDGHAITIREIIMTLWASSFTTAEGSPDFERQKSAMTRAIKASVRRLRRAGHKIGARRGENPGLFIITTQKELSDTVRPLLDQAVDQLRTIEALTGKQYYVRELAGQMRMFDGR